MQRYSGQTQVLGLVGWLFLTFAAAAVGGVATGGAETFYESLDRPNWAPPAELFGPVWTVLYLLIGIAAWLVWRSYGFREAGRALILFIVQLAANALWTWLFFVWHRGALASLEIFLLWCLIIATVVAFSRLHTGAMILLLPYLLWVTYACALTFFVWRLNPDVLG